MYILGFNSCELNENCKRRTLWFGLIFFSTPVENSRSNDPWRANFAVLYFEFYSISYAKAIVHQKWELALLIGVVYSDGHECKTSLRLLIFIMIMFCMLTICSNYLQWKKPPESAAAASRSHLHYLYISEQDFQDMNSECQLQCNNCIWNKI